MRNERTLIHMSDTHFGTEDAVITSKLLDTINKLAPDVLVLSGDITQRAKPQQFKLAREFLRRIHTKNLLCVPGNHDIPLYNIFSRFINPLHQYQRYFGDLSKPIVMESIAIIGINSCNPMHYKNGLFRASHINEVAQFCSAQPSHVFKIVVAHHPVDAILPSDEKNIAVNAEQAVLEWSHAGVDLIMGGHIHCQFSRNLQLRYPSLKEPMMISQAGTANSLRIRSGFSNSFTQLSIGIDSSVNKLTIWNYCDSLKSFEPQQHKWILR